MTSEAMTERGLGGVTVVIDVGTGSMRGGVAGEDNPRCVLPTALAPSEQVSFTPTLLPSFPVCSFCLVTFGLLLLLLLLFLFLF